MRTLHVITGLGQGGAESTLFKLCTSDDSSTHAVVSLTDLGKHGNALRENGFTVWALGSDKSWFRLKKFIELLQIMRLFRPDAVQTWMPHADLIGGLAAKIAGVKRIFWSIRATDYGRGVGTRRTRLVVAILTPLSYLIPRSIISCSIAARDSHLERGYARKIKVIPNGYVPKIPAVRVNRAEILREYQIDPNVKVVGMVGRYHPQKDHENLLKAISLLKSRGTQLVCILIGKNLDSGNAELEGLVNSLNVQDMVVLGGELPDPSRVMGALDLHILSSSHGEGFPNVLAESMLMGTPNVATDVGDSASIIDGNGWVVPPSDHVALADAIESGLTLSKLAAKKMRNKVSKNILERFSVEGMVEAYRNEHSKIEVLVLPRYGPLGASSRVRFVQYFSALEASSFTLVNRPFFDDKYLQRRYKKKMALFPIFRYFFARACNLWLHRKADVLWVEKEFFPWLPWGFERLLVPSKPKKITDYDDPIYLNYEQHSSAVIRLLLKNKIKNVMLAGDLVLAGNSLLVNYALEAGARKVSLFPTVIDMARHNNQPETLLARRTEVVFGWIGTPGTWKEYVVPRLPMLKQVAETNDSQFWVMGAVADPELRRQDWIRFFEWNPRSEMQFLDEVDVGIMPLSDTDWAAGKCGYKLLQHMAVGRPVVASPVGVNAHIVTHGINGFLAKETKDWKESLSILLGDSRLRESFGVKAREEVEKYYNLEFFSQQLAHELGTLVFSGHKS